MAEPGEAPAGVTRKMQSILLLHPGPRGARGARLFHAVDGLGLDEPHVLESPLVEKHSQVVGHLARSGIDGPAGVIKDVPIPHPLTPPVARGEAVRHFSPGPETRHLHSERGEDSLLHELFKFLLRGLFNHVCGHGRTGIAVGHASARFPTRSPRVGKDREALPQGGLRIGLVDILAQRDVIPSRGVLHQVCETNRIRCLPAVFELDLRSKFAQRRLQVEPAILH